MKNENNERTSQEVDLLKKIFGADYFDKVEIPIPTELLTFENEFQKIYDVECSDFAKMFYLKLRLEVLKSTVELSDFVPCGDDGLLFKEPKESDFKDAPNYKMALHRYKKAKQAVIFEGWKLDNNEDTIEDGFCQITNGSYCIQFDLVEEEYICFSADNYLNVVYVSNYSNLAQQTIDNPLKFRK